MFGLWAFVKLSLISLEISPHEIFSFEVSQVRGSFQWHARSWDQVVRLRVVRLYIWNLNAVHWNFKGLPVSPKENVENNADLSVLCYYQDNRGQDLWSQVKISKYLESTANELRCNDLQEDSPPLNLLLWKLISQIGWLLLSPVGRMHQRNRILKKDRLVYLSRDF